jgi:cbb3-type cytochrome oxidase subunit 3
MMQELFDWFMVMANNKSVTLIIFVVTFVSILIYVYGSKKRSKRLETYRNIPFLDDDNDQGFIKGKDQNTLQDNLTNNKEQGEK